MAINRPYTPALGILSVLFLMSTIAGCVSLSMAGGYRGPAPRPPGMDPYYNLGRSYSSVEEIATTQGDDYEVHRFVIHSGAGNVTVDYFQRSGRSDNLVFIFPVLGGRNFIENYFADYFASRGIETAIIHRSNEFKKPENFDKLEQIFRDNVVRDRVVMDYFEKVYGKKQFGSLGLSRGAINVAMTAGVDPRLKYNVLALGGTDLVELFRNTKERRITKYVKAVTEAKGFSPEQMYAALGAMIRTDPKFLSRHMDAENTLLMLGVLDTTVPFSLGMELREQIGNPETILFLADHFTTLLFTQVVKVFPPHKKWCVFPFDYVEAEALAFYRRAFGVGGYPWHLIPIKVMQAPLNLVANLGREVVTSFDPKPPTAEDGDSHPEVVRLTKIWEPPTSQPPTSN